MDARKIAKTAELDQLQAATDEFEGNVYAGVLMQWLSNRNGDAQAHATAKQWLNMQLHQMTPMIMASVMLQLCKEVITAHSVILGLTIDELSDYVDTEDPMLDVIRKWEELHESRNQDGSNTRTPTGTGWPEL